MLVQVRRLLYWKTEHDNVDGCQDAPAYNCTQGLFAVADGAGTSLFPALWARILARHFVATPLMSDDPFEVEWWVRQAQDEYKRQMPGANKAVAWNILQKAHSQGSDSTLATVRIAQVDATSAQAMFLVFGDSCVLLGNQKDQQVSSFILQQAAEFDRAPICVPSDLRFFNRDFHRCQVKEAVTLKAGDQIIIATDAVARWVLGRGDAPAVWDAFQQIASCASLEDWYAFVDAKRQQKELVNDDSTALVLSFCEDAAGTGEQLGYTPSHTQEIIARRKLAFEEAARVDNKELLVIAYGDGKDFQDPQTRPSLDQVNIHYAQEVANALKEVLRGYRLAQNSPDVVAKVRPLWQKYAHLLQDEPCAVNLCDTLRKNGIIPDPPVSPAPALAQVSALPAKPIQLVQPLQDHTPTEPPSWSLSPTIPASGSPAPAKPTPPVANPSQKGREALTQELLWALYEQNEEALLAAYEAIQTAGYRDLLTRIKSDDKQRIEYVRQRKEAVAQFRAALQQPCSPAGLLEAYEIAKHVEPTLALSPVEQELILLARTFVDAWDAGDYYALEKAYNKINQSRLSSMIHFTTDEMKLCGEACEFVERQRNGLNLVIAQIDNRKIDLGFYLKNYIIKRLYVSYKIMAQAPTIYSSTTTDGDADASEVNILRNHLRASDFPLRVLEELTDAVLVNMALVGIIEQGATESLTANLAQEVSQLVNDLQRFEKNVPDPLFRRHGLGKDDLKMFARVVLESKMFAAWLEDQKKLSVPGLPIFKKKTLEGWLRERRGKVNIIWCGENGQPVDQIQMLAWLGRCIECYL